jgi:hypothetical protein
MNFVTACTILPRVDYDVRDPFDTWITSTTLGSGIVPLWSVPTEIIEVETILYLTVAKDAEIKNVDKDLEISTLFSDTASLNLSFSEELEL